MPAGGVGGPVYTRVYALPHWLLEWTLGRYTTFRFPHECCPIATQSLHAALDWRVGADLSPLTAPQNNGHIYFLILFYDRTQ